jgi:hypothetical protein
MSLATEPVQIQAPPLLVHAFGQPRPQNALGYQNESAKQLAAHLNVPHSWILDNSKADADDPIPHLHLGKHKRFRWGSPELTAWIGRHLVTADEFGSPAAHQHADYEYLDSAELAARLNVPESWVRDQVRTRAIEPIPHLRFGKYVRFRWGSAELETWAERRMLFANNRTVGRALRKETVQ